LNEGAANVDSVSAAAASSAAAVCRAHEANLFMIRRFTHTVKPGTHDRILSILILHGISPRNKPPCHPGFFPHAAVSTASDFFVSSHWISVQQTRS